MSDPLSSLKKTRRAPFRIQQEKKDFPTTSPRSLSSPCVDQEDENFKNLADEVTTHMATQRLKESRRGLSSLVSPPDRSRTNMSSTSANESACRKSSKNEDVSDFEIMSIMMSRITQLERRIHEKTMELTEKNRRIRILEEKLLLMQKSQSVEKVQEKNLLLERKFKMMQRQIFEMENFLSDYGLIWVGHDDDDTLEDLSTPRMLTERGQKTNRSTDTDADRVWNPQASISVDFKMNYDLVIHQINELNLLAGADESKIEHSCDGITRLKRPDSVPITLFANGIVLFGGPFRSFSDPSTQQCLQDIMDGFFPSELEDRFPDGVPFNVTDRREVFFKDHTDRVSFHGEGQRLGGSRNTSKLIDTSVVQNSFNEMTDVLPGEKLTMEQFLSHLPSSVVRDGKVISVRSDIKDTLQGQQKSQQQYTLVETDSVRELQARVESGRERKQSAPGGKVATVRVRSEDGKHTFVVRMKFTETIGELRAYLDAQRPVALKENYDIVANYPHRLLSDNHCSIEESGLAPNGTVFLRRRKE